MIFFSVVPTATTQCALTVVRLPPASSTVPAPLLTPPPRLVSSRLVSPRLQIFAPEDGESNADILASYLIAQYAIFVFSSVVLTALTLRNIFS